MESRSLRELGRRGDLHRRVAISVLLAPAAVLGPQNAASLGMDVTGTTSECEPITVTAPVASDAWVDEGSPTSNKGSDSILLVEGGTVNGDTGVVNGRKRTLVRFHMPNVVPPGCVIGSARLNLYSTEENVGARAAVTRLASEWSEASVTWSSQPGATGASVTAWSEQGYLQWNVTHQVAAMYAIDGANHGFLVQDSAEGTENSSEHDFHGREKGESPPFLTISFAAPLPDDPEPPQPPVPATVQCGQVLTQSTLVTNDLQCLGDGLVVGAPRILLDLGGHSITGTGIGVGVGNEGFGTVTIRNGTIEGFDYGVRLAPETTSNVVEELTLIGNEVAAVELFDVASSEVSGNTLDGNGGGISLVSGTTGTIVSGNAVTANGKAGVLLRDVVGNQVEYNTVSGAGDLGIELERADGNTLVGNAISDSSDGGIELLESSDGNHLEGNEVVASGDHGILVSGSGHNVLVSNTAWNMSDSGITFDVVVDSVVRGNDVRFNSGGVQLDGSSRNVLEANDASETSGIGIELGGGSYGNLVVLNTTNENASSGIYVADEALSPDPGNVLERNTANGNSGDGITVAKGGHTIVGNVVRDNGGFGIAAIGQNVDGGLNIATGNVCSGVVCRAEWIPPETTIIGQPADPSDTRATFTFVGSDDVTPPAELAFQCRLDGGATTPCSSPKTYTGLANGSHTFEVRAIDAAGNVDPEPARYTWTVDAPPIVCPESIPVSADMDSWIDQRASSANHGTKSDLRVQSRNRGRNARVLVRFPLPVVEGCAVESATLRLFAFSATTGRTLRVFRVSASWTEGGVTWGNQPSTTGTAVETISGLGYRTWNVTSQVKQMASAGVNGGFLVRDASEGTSGSGALQQFASREASENQPELVLRFVASS